MRIKFTLLFALVSFSIASQKSVLLRMNYQKGDTYVMTSEMTQDQGLLGRSYTSMTMSVSYTNTTSNEITSKIKIKTAKMEIFRGDNLMGSYDSSKENDGLDEMGKAIKTQLEPVMQSTFVNTTNRFGKLLDSKIIPENPVLKGLGPQNTDIEYPKERISVGSSWNYEDENSGLKIKRIYTVDKIENGIVYISISGSASGTLGGKVTGKTEVDIDTGNQNIFEITLTLDASGVEVKATSRVTMTKQY